MLADEWVSPSPEFVKFLMGQVYTGQKTQSRIEQFTKITRNAFRQMIRERVTSALEQSERGVEPEDAATATAEEDPIVTTTDESSGLYVVKAILHNTIDVRRVELRDAKTYAAILLDNTNRKVVCRLWFNGKQKYLGILDTEKNENKIPIDGVDDIFAYADQIRTTAAAYPTPG